ncbi:helix-turn-helix domain-containing protein [Candidatus Pacearchaeota archaeon]|jgi:transcriptional regulator with XRE-family HTH domain|nr:helix-turn-helix domain-containing protein [Candidatus Pacearchaeota archaeon]
MPLADFVKAARESRGLKKHELAVLAGLSPSYLGRIEAGQYKTTSIETLTRLAKALGVSFDEIKTVVVPKSNPRKTEYDIKPKSPADIVRDLTASLPELLPVYEKIADRKAVAYTYLPQPVPKYGGRDMKLIGIRSNIKYKDEIKPGDVLVVAKELPPAPGDLCIRDNIEGIEVCQNDGLPIITIIREKKKIV